MRARFPILSAIMLCVMMTSCATVTADSEQSITVSTMPAGARCILSSSEGNWVIANTPGTASVKRAFAPLSIHCRKSGAGQAETVLEAQTRNRAYGNILLLGYPAFVDAATGDGYEYAPAQVMLTLK